MSLPVITIFARETSPRLLFVLDWLFREQLALPYHLTTDLQEARAAAYALFYGEPSGSINMYAAGLLAETDIRPQQLTLEPWQDLQVLFLQKEATHTIPFDVLSAIFFLLTRYEEYLPFTPDRHGRFPYTASILRTVMERPVVDEWVGWFRKLLEQELGLSLPPKQFSFQPSYDIDIAWSYRHKGWKRWLGAAFREMLSGNITAFSERLAVLRNAAPDPYDSFRALDALHEKYRLRPLYFVLSALVPTRFDKNVHPEHPQMKKLIRSFAGAGNVGIHPSYQTKNNTALLAAEKNVLQDIIGKPVHISRQHYIRLFFPDTYRMLLSANITDDYSMGYSTTPGFRAGTSHSFRWFEPGTEQLHPLRIHPFCFMDTTAHFDQSMSREAAFSKLNELTGTLQQHGGVLTTIFHNFSLGTDPEWAGWYEAYEQFLDKMAGQAISGRSR